MVIGKKGILALTLLLCMVWFCSVRAEIPSGIEISLHIAQQEFSVDESITLEFAYQNITGSAISMLKWGTAFESRLNSDILAIFHEGKELHYSGRHIKRAPAGESDYVVLKAQSVARRKVDLLTAYSIDLKGIYEIRLRESRTLSKKAESPIFLKLSSDRSIVFKRTPSVDNCPDGVAGLPNKRLSLIDSAVSAAESIALIARGSLRGTPIAERPNARRYLEWFGGYNLTRWNTIQSHFDLIYNAVKTQVLVFICEDNEDFFAAVSPSNPYDIFLGKAFWSAPRSGTDSKAGTIIHELSHFNILGGTVDNVYGQSAARSLARNNPSSAINNADNHEYFAENTPLLSMPTAEVPVKPEPEPESGKSPLIIAIINFLLVGGD
jgi:peptidyl-Lys metalloendopeptidase